MKRGAKMRIIFVELLLLFICNLTIKAGDVFSLDSLCKNINNSGECAQAIERNQSPKYKKEIVRIDTNTLEVKTIKGQPILLKNISNSDGDNFYYFIDYLPQINSFLFRVQLIEGNYFLLVNKDSGDTTSIDDIPIISPSGKMFVTCSMDLEAGYNPTRIQIWKIENRKPVHQQDIDIAASDLSWVNEKELNFNINEWQDNSPEFKKTSQKLIGASGS